MNRRVRIGIRGIVQGVGFRPFIFKLARQKKVDGWVRNQADGVAIEAAGVAYQVDSFIEEIPRKAPPLAHIVRLEVEELPFEPLGPFHIQESQAEQEHVALISPDMSICGDCRRELLDPLDRRHRYPFINCTNCGPRYTIINDIPYDRQKTTMARFTMCPACQREYHDPLDRRFHAQPNACWECGPQVWLETADGKILARKDDAIRKTVNDLTAGAIVAIKGLGGFHLAVVATDADAVQRLRSRKVREEKPFAVMFPNLAAIARYCRIGEVETRLLLSGQRPIVLLERCDSVNDSFPPIAAAVAPRNRLLGAFLPYTPLHCLLFDGSTAGPLVMTSGNRSDEPIAMENGEARSRLRDIADVFLFHDRDIYMRCDDSVTRVVAGKPRPIRRARGHVPVPVFLAEPVPEVLGVGAELKNTVCITREREAFLGQHIGDLENLETLRSFEHSIAHLERILHVTPQLLVHDLHPDYLSTQWAFQQKDKVRLAVQHHHAHIAAVVAERNVSGPMLGLALDGTGYGSDGTIWGGELLWVEADCCTRLGHFRQVPLPGGNMAVREPWRMAVSYLWSLDPQHCESRFQDILARWGEREGAVILKMLAKSINAPLTSSCGRLFDAMAALAGIRDVNVYEGQAAIELEQVLLPDTQAYRGAVLQEGGKWVLDPLPMWHQAVEDVRRNTNAGILSARFHNGLVNLLTDAAICVRQATGLHRVALSGGVFQNTYLSENLERSLEQHGFEVFCHVEVPPNDGCIALGQAYLGGLWLRRQERHIASSGTFVLDVLTGTL